MENPLITVIIPAHDSAQTVGTAIKSIADQTYRNLEILIVDDNSTDGTKEAVEAFLSDSRIKYRRLPIDDPQRMNKRGRNINAGYMARNFGLDEARGEYITFQDADDASFKNRIETQLGLLKEHDALHVCLDWQRFDQAFLRKSFDVQSFLQKSDAPSISSGELFALSQKTKGVAYKILGKLASAIPFELKTARLLNKLFFGSLVPYPGTGNSPLFARKVAEKVRFRKLADRVWPSFVGRGADRDFNFQVSETFRKSFVFFVPLYMWRQEKQNERYGEGLRSFIV